MDWYPWYPDLYAADTMHLTHYQDSCYRRLIDHYMKTRQPLPDNDHALARIVGDSYENWMANGSAIARPFFRAHNGLLFLPKCDEILNHQDSMTNKLSANGKKGAEKRWSKIKYINSLAIAPPLEGPMAPAIAQDITGEDKEKNNLSVIQKEKPKSRGSRLDRGWELSAELGKWAMQQGLTREQVLLEEQKFFDYWTAKSGKEAVKIDWDATWRNWIRNTIERKSERKRS